MSNYLLRAKKAKNNEFYTEYKTMEYLFESEEHKNQFRNFVKNKIIYLPCDAEWSNIYKYFVNNQKNLEIKEILRTDDDYYSHLDLYKKADLIFTNPPFTGLYKWVSWLLNMNKEFVLWGPWLSLSWARYTRLSLYNNVLKILTKYTENEITCYSPDKQKSVAVFIFSNIKTIKKHNSVDLPDFTNNINNIKTYNSIPYIKKFKDFPKDYYDEIIIPTICIIRRLSHFEIINTIDVIDDDGISRRRCIAKLKRSENEEKETN